MKEEQVSFLIEVTMPEDMSKATVKICAKGMKVTVAAQMIATEHMMTLFAASSSAGFEEALELLCEGARTNRVKLLEQGTIQ